MKGGRPPGSAQGLSASKDGASQPKAARLGTLNIHRLGDLPMAQSVDASAQLANLELLSKNDPAVYAALLGEEARERSGIELIPSENYAFPEVLAVLGAFLPTSIQRDIRVAGITARSDLY